MGDWCGGKRTKNAFPIGRQGGGTGGIVRSKHWMMTGARKSGGWGNKKWSLKNEDCDQHIDTNKEERMKI